VTKNQDDADIILISAPKQHQRVQYNDKKVLAEAEEREYKPEDWISTWKRVDSP
jgi:hypothetical protein